MNHNTERIERYLQGMHVPQSGSDLHRQRLRGRILQEIEGRQTMSIRFKARNIAALIAAVICTGAIAATVGVTVRQYYFEGQDTEGRYYVFAKDPEIVSASSHVDPNGTGTGYALGRMGGSVITVPVSDQPVNMERLQRDILEIDSLRQQNRRKLVGVSDTEVNGRFCYRSFSYEYTLADGRTKTFRENGLASEDALDQAQIAKDNAQIALLRQQGRKELVSVDDLFVGGQVQRVCTYRYVLADGRERIIGEPDPQLRPPVKPISPALIREVSKMRRLKQGTSLGTQDRIVNGKLLTFENNLFTLPDGTIVTQATGTPKGVKTDLTNADWDELRSLQQANKGQDLGTEEKTVFDHVFSFTKQRFVLHDGTEVIQSTGTPKEGL